jgi:hypothetical protein
METIRVMRYHCKPPLHFLMHSLSMLLLMALVSQRNPEGKDFWMYVSDDTIRTMTWCLSIGVFLYVSIYG